MKKSTCCFLFLLVGATHYLHAQIPEKLRFFKASETIVCPAVLKMPSGEQLVGQAFQQDALVSHNGYQYTIYYSADRHLCIARRKLPCGQWMEVKLPYTTHSNDPHNVPVMGICPNDGTIHLSYDHHDMPLHYCRSVIDLANKPETIKWDAAHFGENTSALYDNKVISGVCYPRFIQKPDGNLFFECRHGSSGDGDSFLREYNGHTHQWGLVGRYIQGRDADPDVCAYINRIDYDINNVLHVSWVWRESPTASTNHDLSYAYSEDNGLTWKNTSGKTIAMTEKIEPTSDRATGSSLHKGLSGLVVAPIAQKRGLINQESQTTDSKGRIHALNSYMPDAEPDNTDWTSSRSKAVLHQHYRDTDGTWKMRQIKRNGNRVTSACRSQIICDAFDNAFVIANQTEIFAATSANNYNDWGLISDIDANRFCSEPQIDHKRILSEGVLSFVCLTNDARLVVIDYLLDNPHISDGSGLQAEYFSDKQYSQLIDKENHTAIGNMLAVPEKTKSIRWSGILETKYAQQYSLHIQSDAPFSLYINGKKLLEAKSAGEYTVQLPPVASHKHPLILETVANRKNKIALYWSGDDTLKEIIPISFLHQE